MKSVMVSEVSPAQPKQNDYAKRPEADHAVEFPRKTSPPDVSPNDQASSPRFNSGPPHNESSEYENDQQKPAKAVNAAAFVSGEQIVMQLEKLGNDSDAERRRVAEIFACVRIE